MAQQLKSEFQPVKRESTSGSATTRTLARGLAVLSAILDAEVPLTLTQIAARTELSKATVSRLLMTLTEAGYAAQPAGEQSYVIGPALAPWLRTTSMEILLEELASPLIADLCDLSGETSALFVPAWPDRVCVLCHAPPLRIRAHRTVGETGPLTLGSSGRAFLAFAPEANVNAALRARPLAKLTPNSVTDVAQFMRLLRREREQGYSFSVGGTYIDSSGISVPVFGPASAMPVAVISIGGPSVRWTRERMEAFAPTLQGRSAELSSDFTSRKAL
jgi:DNA-binding IclR family transcriptional regulator